MEKTKEDLLAYTLKMRKRGDDYSDMIGYLKRHTTDEELIQQILRSVSKLEEAGHVKIEKPVSAGIPAINKILGTGLIVAGAYLVIFLWGEGFIASIPLIMIGFGIMAILGSFR